MASSAALISERRSTDLRVKLIPEGLAALVTRVQVPRLEMDDTALALAHEPPVRDSGIIERFQPSPEQRSSELRSSEQSPSEQHPSELPSRVRPVRTWGELYRDHADFVWRSLRRMGLSPDDAQDAMQEVFLIVHRRQDVFDPEQGSERGWLFGIAANVVRSERRRKRAHLFLDESGCERPGGASGTVLLGEASWRATDGAATASGHQLRATLRRAVEALSPEHRAVFTMFEIEGIDCGSIAAELSIPVGTVYSRLHKARETLQRALQEYRRTIGGKR